MQQRWNVLILVMDNGELVMLLLLPGTCTFAQGGKRIHYIPKVGSDLHVHVSAMSVRGRRAVDTCTTRSWGKEAGEKKIKDGIGCWYTFVVFEWNLFLYLAINENWSSMVYLQTTPCNVS